MATGRSILPALLFVLVMECPKAVFGIRPEPTERIQLLDSLANLTAPVKVGADGSKETDQGQLYVQSIVGGEVAEEKQPARSRVHNTVRRIHAAWFPRLEHRIEDAWKHLASALSAAVLFKAACMVSNVIVQVSPMPTAKAWERRGTTGITESLPFIAMGVNGWQWCTYAIAAWILTENSGYLVLLFADCLAALLGSYYTFLFFRNCRNAETGENLKQYLVIVMCLVVCETCMWLLVPPSVALFLHSFFAGACGFASATSLLSTLPIAFRTGDTSGFCMPLVVAKLCGATLWVYWGMLMHEPVMTAVSMLSFATSCACLYARFLHKPKACFMDLAIDGLTTKGTAVRTHVSTL